MGLRTHRVGVWMAVIALTGGCAALLSPPRALPSGVVAGSVLYFQRIALPPDATLHLTLYDLDARNPRVAVIGRRIVQNVGQVPIPFEVRYDPAGIDPDHAYGLEVQLVSGTRRLFETRVPAPVITKGNPETLDVLVRPVES